MFVTYVGLFMGESPRAWYERYQSAVTRIGFSSSAHDSALFVRHSSSGPVILLLYVDDMIITGPDTAGIMEVKHHLLHEFEMKDLGPLRDFLGIEVASSPLWFGFFSPNPSMRMRLFTVLG